MDKLSPKGFRPEQDIAAGRMGRPCMLQSALAAKPKLTSSADIANAAVFLFSPAASFITGTILPVDGAESHLRGLFLPYPASVLDPESMKALIKPKL